MIRYIEYFLNINMLFLLFIFNGNIYGNNNNADSLRHIIESDIWQLSPDTAKADIYRRLSIELMRKSPEKVIEYAGKYLQLAKTIGNKTDEAIALNLLGGAYKTTGDFDRALEFYKKSLQIRKEINDKQLIANSLNNIGLVYCKKGEISNGLSYFKKALDYRYALNDKSGIAQTLNNIGVVYKITEKYDSAFIYLEQSLEIKRSLNDKELIASSLNNLGELYAISGNSEKSRIYFEEALEKRIEIDDKIGIVLSSINLSTQSNQKGKFHESLDYIQSALILINSDFSDTNIYTNPEMDIVYDLNVIGLLAQKAVVLKDLYYHNKNNVESLSAALKTYKLILKILNNIRKLYTDENSKLFLLKNTRIYYEEAIETVIELLWITKDEKYKYLAFEFAEQSKTNILLDRIREHEAKVFAKIPDSVLIKEITLKKQIAELQKAIYSNQNNENSGWLEQKELELFNLKYKLNNFILNIERNYPAYYKIKFSNKIYSVSEIQKVLKTDDVILEYLLTDSYLFTFIISDCNFNIMQIPVDSIFTDNVEHFYSLLSTVQNHQNRGSDFDNYTKTASYLYKYLIEPVKINYNQKNLIIIPDGILSFIPFDALLSKVETKNNSFKTLHYLIRENSITYNYSSSLYYKAMKKTTKPKCMGLLSFAVSFKKTDYKYDDDEIDLLRNRDEELSELVGVVDEVNSISELFSGEVYHDKNATECRFKKMSEDYCIIHLATHGILDNDNPMFSRLVFYNDSLCPEDGNLYTYELFNMKLDAELAVLSACKTGFGKLHQGEGMMTMARGFLFAGVPSLVISLWNVNDFSTGILMKYFYKYLERGQNKNEALRLAKLDFINNSDEVLANPMFWADFIQIGNTNPVKIQRKYHLIMFTVLGFFILFVVFLLYRTRYSGKGR